MKGKRPPEGDSRERIEKKGKGARGPTPTLSPKARGAGAGDQKGNSREKMGKEAEQQSLIEKRKQIKWSPAEILRRVEKWKMNYMLQQSLEDTGAIDEEAAIQEPVNFMEEGLGITTNKPPFRMATDGDCLLNAFALGQTLDITEEENAQHGTDLRRIVFAEAIQWVRDSSAEQLLPIQTAAAARPDPDAPDDAPVDWVSKEELIALLERYSQNGQWSGQIGDLMPQIVSSFTGTPLFIISIDPISRQTIGYFVNPAHVFNMQEENAVPRVLVRQDRHYNRLLVPEEFEEALTLMYRMSTDDEQLGMAAIQLPYGGGGGGNGDQSRHALATEPEAPAASEEGADDRKEAGQGIPGIEAKEEDPGRRVGEDDSGGRAGEGNLGASVGEGDPGAQAGEGNSGTQTQEGGSCAPSRQALAAEPETPEADRVAEEDDPGTGEDNHEVKDVEHEDRFEVSQDQHASSVEPTTPMETSSGVTTKATKTAPTLTTTHGSNMAALSARLNECVLQDTPIHQTSSNTQSNEGHRVEEEQKKEDLNSPVEDHPDAEEEGKKDVADQPEDPYLTPVAKQSEEKEREGRDVDHADTPDEPDFPLCYAIHCQSPARYRCTVCKRSSCWVHLWKVEVPGGKVFACWYPCFGRHLKGYSPKSALEGMHSYWMGNVKGHDLRLNS